MGFEKRKEFFKCNPCDIKFIFEKYKNACYVTHKEKTKENIIKVNEIDKNIIKVDKIDKNIIKVDEINKNIIKVDRIDKKFACQTCAYETTYSSNWLKHIRSIKHIKKNPISKPFNCICGKGFNQNSSLSRHKRTCERLKKNTKIITCEKKFINKKEGDDNIKIIDVQTKNLLLDAIIKYLNEPTK